MWLARYVAINYMHSQPQHSRHRGALTSFGSNLIVRARNTNVTLEPIQNRVSSPIWELSSLTSACTVARGQLPQILSDNDKIDNSMTNLGLTKTTYSPGASENRNLVPILSTSTPQTCSRLPTLRRPAATLRRQSSTLLPSILSAKWLLL
jgi:hypothetical protein